MADLELTSSSLYPEEVEVSVTESELNAHKGDSKTRPNLVGINDVVGVMGKMAGKKKRPMLTSSQLSDLFTRLDKLEMVNLILTNLPALLKC